MFELQWLRTRANLRGWLQSFSRRRSKRTSTGFSSVLSGPWREPSHMALPTPSYQSITSRSCLTHTRRSPGSSLSSLLSKVSAEWHVIKMIHSWFCFVLIRTSVLYTIHEQVPIHEYLPNIRVLDVYTTWKLFTRLYTKIFFRVLTNKNVINLRKSNYISWDSCLFSLCGLRSSNRRNGIKAGNLGILVKIGFDSYNVNQ